MDSAKKKDICLIVPSLHPGGMERVMSELANFLVTDKNLKIHLILMVKKPIFYKMDHRVNIYEYDFNTNEKLRSTLKLLQFLRKKVKKIDPISVLSFGSKYNSFVLLSLLGLKFPVYVSDRSNPYRNTYLTFKKGLAGNHDGAVHYFLKQWLYKTAKGLVVQTQKAKEIEKKSLNHKNIIYIPNPIVKNESVLKKCEKEKIIINTGRFIQTKQQELLIDFFYELNIPDWKLVFLGDGPGLESAKEKVRKLGLQKRVIFEGTVQNVYDYYNKAEIFAFTSISEGFPNVLGEALNAGLACISFDCVAGPSDLIEHNYNGFLISENDHKAYKKHLKELMLDPGLRLQFKKGAEKYMRKFDRTEILNKFKTTLMADS